MSFYWSNRCCDNAGPITNVQQTNKLLEIVCTLCICRYTDGRFSHQWPAAEATSSRLSTRHVTVLSTSVRQDSRQQCLWGLSTASDGDCPSTALPGCSQCWFVGNRGFFDGKLMKSRKWRNLTNITKSLILNCKTVTYYLELLPLPTINW